MNNTKNILLVALITATLVLGTGVIPMQSYADRDDDDDHKKDKDFKSKTSANHEQDKKSASQHQDQDNVCYRGNDTCTQANEGQELIGEDNDAIGFNDQSNNLPALSPSALTTNPTTNPATNPGTNIFFTTNNNNVTINVDNSICDQTNTGSTNASGGPATATSGVAIASNGPQSVSATVTQTPVNGSNATVSLPISVSATAASSTSATADASASGDIAQSCQVTLSDPTQGVGFSSPVITPNPTGEPCTAPLVNAFITTTNSPRTLDVCVAL